VGESITVIRLFWVILSLVMGAFWYGVTTLCATQWVAVSAGIFAVFMTLLSGALCMAAGEGERIYEQSIRD